MDRVVLYLQPTPAILNEVLTPTTNPSKPSKTAVDRLECWDLKYENIGIKGESIISMSSQYRVAPIHPRAHSLGAPHVP